MCGDSRCAGLSQSLGASRLKLRSQPEAVYLAFCRTLKVEPGDQSTAEIKSSHFLPKFIECVHVPPNGPPSCSPPPARPHCRERSGKRTLIKIADANNPPLPNVSFDSMQFALSDREHVKARVLDTERPSGRRVSFDDRPPRTTRAQRSQEEALGGAALSSAQRLSTIASDREPAPSGRQRARTKKQLEDDAAKAEATAAAKTAGSRKRSRKSTKRQSAAAPPAQPEAEEAANDLLAKWGEAGPRLTFSMLKHDPAVRKAATALTNFPSADACVAFYDLLNVGNRAQNMLLWNFHGDGQPKGRGHPGGSGPHGSHPFGGRGRGGTRRGGGVRRRGGR